MKSNLVKVTVVAKELADTADVGPEALAKAPEALAKAIVAAAYDGEFDGLPAGHRVFVRDWVESLKYLEINGTLQKPDIRLLKIAIAAGTFFVHPAAAKLFAARRHMAPPAKLERPIAKSASVASVSAFLIEIADGQRTEAECLELARRRFGSISRDHVWRPAWGALDPARRRGRGNARRNARTS